MARRIMIRDMGNCIYCDGIATQVDHVIPASKDGPDIMANGVACCTTCNMRKKGRLTEKYLVKGLIHLANVGENISWVDNLYVYRMSSELIECANLLFECDISRSDISSMLKIDEETLSGIIGEERYYRKSDVLE